MQHREVTRDELYRDLELKKTPLRQRVQLERRQDPVESLVRPLPLYDDRAFFYLGLLYGFCQIGASVTEKFREASGSTIKSWMHFIDHPVMTLMGMPQFGGLQIGRCLCSIERHALQSVFFDYMQTQALVDRKRNTVWRCRVKTITIPDPYTTKNLNRRQMVPIQVFCPYTPTFEIYPVHTDLAKPGIPEAQQFNRADALFKAEAERILSNAINEESTTI